MMRDFQATGSDTSWSSRARTSRWCWRRSLGARVAAAARRGGRGSGSGVGTVVVLRRDDRRRAVGDARGGDGDARARRRPDRATARDRLDPGRRRAGAAGARSVAGLVDRVPALGDGHRRHGRAGVADRRAAPAVPAGAGRARGRDHARRAARRHAAPAVPLPRGPGRRRSSRTSWRSRRSRRRCCSGSAAAAVGLVSVAVGHLARRARADPDALPRVGRRPAGEGARRPRHSGGGPLC